MLKLSFDKKKSYNILCLGSHSDDIEIGCGGTMLHLSRAYQVNCRWVVFSSSPGRKKEAQASSAMFLKNAKSKEVIIKNFRNGYFPYAAAGIKDYFEKMKEEFNPDIVFTHYRADLHQDHRLISELTWNTFRNHLVLEYEIPKYDGDLGSPNVFVLLDKNVCQKKIEHLLESFPSQKEKHWFSAETFWSLLRLRGMESASPSNYAEAFYVRKACF
jgi:LmbE family N-acetylglucosaminyl deacetylase